MKEKRKTLDKKINILKLKKITKKQKLQEQGITLIALVVTIIILLILSGVTLNIALSDNGLFKKAKEAVDNYKTATIEEQKQIAMAEASMNLNGTEYKSKYKGEDVTVPIPAGYAVSDVEGENTVEDGLVIIDSEGNEFVWIPVTSEEEYVKKLGTYNSEYCDDLKNEILGDDLGITSILGESIGSGIQSQPEKKIVVDAGGFYVGRYEAGVEVNGQINWEENPEIVVKKNVQPARGLLYTEMRQLANNYKVEKDVQSGLITGTEWDVMCEFIGWEITNSENTTWANFRTNKSGIYSGYRAVKGSLDWTFVGNVVKEGNEENTGQNVWVFPTGRFVNDKGVNTAKKNIFDIAGNVYENTTEVYYAVSGTPYRTGE